MTRIEFNSRTPGYDWLSNFGPPLLRYGAYLPQHEPIVDWVEEISAEHLYHAAKATNARDKLIVMAAKSPKEAKAAGRQITCRPDWNDVKDAVQRNIIQRKLQHDWVRQKLLATKDAELVHATYWHDTYWGVCNCAKHQGAGKNTLGKLWMEARDRLRQKKVEDTLVVERNEPPTGSLRLCTTCQRPFSILDEGGTITECHHCLWGPDEAPKYYAGIGSRETPQDVCELMVAIGQLLAENGWVLRSGGARGADSAFEKGCDKAGGKKEIFVSGDASQAAWNMASQNFPWFGSIRSSYVQGLIARNMHQVFGQDLQMPVDVVICYDPLCNERSGTRYATTVAERAGIQVVNLWLPAQRQLMENKLKAVCAARKEG